MPALTAKGRDDLVMGTNSSSIVSKRSVERIYFPNEPQYYRYFVKKFQRRAPLINRGYHLRMHLIDVMVREFLSRPSSSKKVVVNLGCGSDPLPWRSMFRYAGKCQGVKFVDVDFPDLLALKCHVVEQTPELQEPLSNLRFPQDSRILVDSEQYCQIACDLRQLSAIEEALSQVVDVSACEFFFVAEVSITYMEPVDADALIRWAGTLKYAEFCLLEQILPDGPSNPFAQTMLQHFNKLNTPIKCIYDYPTTGAQQQRFINLGWSDSRIWTMWEAWSDPFFLTSTERQDLDKIEVFDEWEEFANFASHYFVLYARNGAPMPDAFKGKEIATTQSDSLLVPITGIRLDFSPISTSKNLQTRRFGAPLIMKNVLGQETVANFFGFGGEGRLRSCDLYSNNIDQTAPLLPASLHQGGPAARSGFSVTDMGDSGYLLVGGRASPTAPFSDVWLFKKDTNQWEKSHELPVPLFRHSVVRLGHSQLALLAGGKSDPYTVSPDFLLRHPALGWMRCVVKGELRPKPLFGSVFVTIAKALRNASTFYGVLAGGMTVDGLICREVFNWTLDVGNVKEPVIHFELTKSKWATSLLSRFGSICTQVDDWTVVSGGILSNGSVLQEREVVRFRSYGSEDEIVDCLEYVDQLGQDTPRPILVGSSIIGTGSGDIAIIGGGMTCFSMGTTWSKGVYTFNVQQPMKGEPNIAGKSWQYLKTLTITNQEPRETGGPGRQSARPSVATPIPRMKLSSEEEFKAILQTGKPVVFEGLDLGGCVTKWNPSYLGEKIGAERKIVVHESTSQVMDFVAKNFQYTTRTFKEFINGVNEGKKSYLRALSADKPSEVPARLEADFPTIAGDFSLPRELAFASGKLFSSVLRISGPVNMWLHYDVLANVYCQIQGSKRFYLFPPADVTQLGFAPGASSSGIDIFSALASSSLPHCHPHEAVVGPGDVLFLPQLWLHTATPISMSSIAVNVFFRDLDSGYSLGRDVYGNRDLSAYEKARQDISKISKTFQDLPRDTRGFYLRRVADELLQMALE